MKKKNIEKYLHEKIKIKIEEDGSLTYYIEHYNLYTEFKPDYIVKPKKYKIKSKRRIK